MGFQRVCFCSFNPSTRTNWLKKVHTLEVIETPAPAYYLLCTNAHIFSYNTHLHLYIFLGVRISKMNFWKPGFYRNTTENDYSHEPPVTLARMHEILPKPIIDLGKCEEKSRVNFHLGRNEKVNLLALQYNKNKMQQRVINPNWETYTVVIVIPNHTQMKQAFTQKSIQWKRAQVKQSACATY